MSRPKHTITVSAEWNDLLHILATAEDMAVTGYIRNLIRKDFKEKGLLSYQQAQSFIEHAEENTPLMTA